MHNEQDLKNTPEYRSGMFRIVTCPVCGYPTLDRKSTRLNSISWEKPHA